MANVMIIPAKRRSTNSSLSEKPKLRVAAYCRVSTDSDEQATSYEAQIEHYTSFITKNPDWVLAGIYADDGISGTNTKNREQFKKMIEECTNGSIDMVITKSISRFARNTLDCLKYIRLLKEKNIPVFFEKENINTMDSKGEVLLTIMASLAQQESQSLSQNVKMGLQFRYQNGQVLVNHNYFLGYTKDKDGNLVIEPEQAETVKRIYREFLEGSSMDKIAKGLERDGIKTGAGKTKWWTRSIKTILSNEKYIGDALLQKTCTTDFLNKTRVKNTGIAPQYYVENSHPAIIEKDIFLLAQKELNRRHRVRSSASGKTHTFSSNTCFSQIVTCASCGEIYRRIHWNNRGKKSIVWRCLSRLENTGHFCNARTIDEELLKEVSLKAINTLLSDKSTYQEMLEENIKKVLLKSHDAKSEEYDKKLLELQQELISKANNKDSYDEIANQILYLREEKEKLILEKSSQDALTTKINEIKSFLHEQKKHITKFDEALVKRYIKDITVHDEHFTIELKSGIKVDIEG